MSPDAGIVAPRRNGRAAAFSAEIAQTLSLREEQIFVASAPPKPMFAAIEYRVDEPHGELSQPIPPGDAYLIAVQLGVAREKTYWEEGREVARCVRVTGESSISDVRRDPRLLIDTPVHALLYYLPRTAMNALAEDAGLPPVGDLRFDPGEGFADATLLALSRALLPALRAPDQANRLFADNVALALASHMAAAYGGRDLVRSIRGGLAPWQEKRAKEMILADLPGRQPLVDVAAACGLSADHFARAFRQTTGLTPHAWLLNARVDRAMSLLRRRDEPLAAIAAACGFTNASHFARVFTRYTGLSPSVWRRLNLH